MSPIGFAIASPFAVDLIEGKRYAWCTCGGSANHPFCDGGHIGTEFRPVIFTADATKTAHLCGCKATKNGPVCDGAHNSLTTSRAERQERKGRLKPS